jgi:hypothetical protein
MTIENMNVQAKGRGRRSRGGIWSAADVHALSLTNIQGENAENVSGAMAPQAEGIANMRMRRRY